MKTPLYPGGTLRLATRRRDQDPPVPPLPIPPDAAPAAKGRALPEAVVRREANLRRDREAREAAVVRRRQQTHEVLTLLRGRWPEAFTSPVPLAIGIVQEIRASLGNMPVSSEQLGRALYFWTHGLGYLATVAAGQRRRHLDGTDAGEPDEAQRRHARETMAKRGQFMNLAQKA